MLYLAIALVFVLVLVLKLIKKRERIEDMDILFNTELQKIKNDSVLNFIDVDFLDKNFEFFGTPKYSLPANDEDDINYHITSLQDLTPLDLA